MRHPIWEDSHKVKQGRHRLKRFRLKTTHLEWAWKDYLSNDLAASAVRTLTHTLQLDSRHAVITVLQTRALQTRMICMPALGFEPHTSNTCITPSKVNTGRHTQLRTTWPVTCVQRMIPTLLLGAPQSPRLCGRNIDPLLRCQHGPGAPHHLLCRVPGTVCHGKRKEEQRKFSTLQDSDKKKYMTWLAHRKLEPSCEAGWPHLNVCSEYRFDLLECVRRVMLHATAG